MTINEAIEILKRHNEWRRCADIEMGDPIKLGLAIDLIVDTFTHQSDAGEVDFIKSLGVKNKTKSKSKT